MWYNMCVKRTEMTNKNHTQAECGIYIESIQITLIIDSKSYFMVFAIYDIASPIAPRATEAVLLAGELDFMVLPLTIAPTIAPTARPVATLVMTPFVPVSIEFFKIIILSVYAFTYIIAFKRVHILLKFSCFKTTKA